MTERVYLGPRVPPAVPGGPQGAVPARPGAGATAGSSTAPADFRSALSEATAALRLSAHASERLRQSGRTLGPADIAAVGAAIDQAAARGARESLILLRDLALVVSIPNRTVITAVAGERMKGNVFTQIDSAVIVP